jgi:pimeloyl-ACP methyl ester carboxylesterase
VYGGEEATPFLVHAAGHRELLAPALPGYNGSTGLENIEDIEDAVWHLADLFDALELESVDVIAHSLGGWFATELALRHPHRVHRLVLVAPLGLHVPGVEVPPFFGAAAPRGVGGMSEVRRLLFGHPEGDEARRALPDVMETDVQLRWFGGLAGAARLGWKAPHFQSRKLARHLARLRVPTLVVRGEDDVLVPSEVAQTWVETIPGARLRTLPGAGHCLPLEQPAVAHEALAFLSESARGRS